jgi:type I restriction enzyme, S subunit
MELKMDSRYSPYPSTRDSGLPWLGHIPAQWDVLRVKYSTYVKARVGWQGLTSDEFIGEGPILVTGTDFTDGRVNWQTCYHVSEERYIQDPFIMLNEGDLLITKDGTIGKIAIVGDMPDKATLNSGVFVTRPLKNVYLTRYLYWVLVSKIFLDFIEYIKSGTTINHLYQNAFVNFVFPKPSLAEQQTIATFLDRQTAKIDALIAKKQRLLDLLAEQRSALISQSVTKGLNPDVQMKDSGVMWLGQVPKHWEVMALKYAVVNRLGAIKTGPFGSQLLSSEMLEGEIKVYNQRSVIDRDFTAGENYITKDKYQELLSFTTYPGDVLLTTRGTIGRCAILPENAEPGILHPCLMRIQPHPKRLLAEYLSLLIQDAFLLQTQLFLLSNATTIDVIYSDTMKKMIIPIPSISEQKEIIDYLQQEVGKINALIAKVETAIDRLREYRSALISSAVMGKIYIKAEG